MERQPDSSLIIGVATTTAERVQLARLLSGADALLLVSSAEQARAFLDLTTAAESTSVVQATPPAAQIEAVLPILPSSLPMSGDWPTSSRLSPHAAEQPASVTELPGGLRLDDDRRVVRWQDREMPLTRLEHDFLHCLVKEPGTVWTYQRLHHAVWGNEFLGHGSHIHSVVKRLRQKLAELGAAVTIHAVRGVGFHLLPT